MALYTKNKKKKCKKNYVEDLIESDDTFAYIAGYTEGGFAYGITWEEWEKIEKEDTEKKQENKLDSDELPF